MRHCLIIYLLLTTLHLYSLEVKDFTFSHLGRTEGIDNERVFSLCQTPSGAIWWSTMTGVGRYNGSKVMNYRLDKNTPYSHMGGRVINMTYGENKIYAFDNRGSVFVFNPQYDCFDLVISISQKLGHEVSLNDIHVMGNKLVLAMHDGVYMLKDTTLTQVMKSAYVSKIVPVRNRLLFCARDGIYDERSNQLLPYNAEYGYYDEMSGRLWIGGYENGLHLITLDKKGKITADDFVRLSDMSPYQNPIRSICPYDDDTMLIGVDGEGVFQMRRDGRGDCTLLFDANDSEYGVLHGNGVYSMLVDKWQNIVIGSYSGGIDIARPIGSTTAIYQHLANNGQSLLNDHVNMVMPLSADMLLMGTDNGISITNFTTGQWHHSCQGTVVLSACKKPDGGVLIATYGKGLLDIDSHGMMRKVYTKDNSPLSDDHVYSAFYDKDGGLWVGSLNGDLLYEKTPNAQLQSPETHYYPISRRTVHHAVSLWTDSRRYCLRLETNHPWRPRSQGSELCPFGCH